MDLRLRLILAAAALCCACHPSEPPVARISPVSPLFVRLQGPVVLDGSQSSDPDGEPLTFAWSFFSRPSGSRAVLSEPTAARTSFNADLPGEYVVLLVVSDSTSESEPAIIKIPVWQQKPYASTDTELDAVVGTPLTLSGSGMEWEEAPITYSWYSWTLTQRPTGSTAVLTGADTTTPSLTPDVEGEYQLSFVVGDGYDTSPAVTVTVTAHRPIQLLGHRVADAEYSKALDRLVMVSELPNALYVYDPVTRTESSVVLPKAPSSVSVGPDGRFAAVGHDSLVSYVDLAIPRLLKTLPVSGNHSNLVLAGNDYAYVFPEGGQWNQTGKIHSIHLSTGVVTLNDSMSSVTGKRMRLHPNGTAIYGITRLASPPDLEKYDISSGTAQVLYDSPYYDEYPMCDDLWFSEDGDRIFNSCGNIFRASSVLSEDMRYVGVISGASSIRHLSHSTAADRIALVVGTTVHLFMSDPITSDRSMSLPPFVRNGKTYTGDGRFVFFNAAGDKLLVILQADPESTMLHDYGIVTY